MCWFSDLESAYWQSTEYLVVPPDQNGNAKNSPNDVSKTVVERNEGRGKEI